MFYLKSFVKENWVEGKKSESFNKPLQYFYQCRTKLNTFAMLSQRLLAHHELEFVEITFLDQCDASS